MSEPRVSEQDRFDVSGALALLDELRAEIAAMPARMEALAAARQAAEQRAERLAEWIKAIANMPSGLASLPPGLNPFYDGVEQGHENARVLARQAEREDAARGEQR